MIFSNSTLEEMRREAESSNNELAFEILKKLDEIVQENVRSRSEEYTIEVQGYAVNAVNDDIASMTVELLKSVFEAKGGKRKTLEAIQQFRLDVENGVMADEAEMLEHFLNDVPDKFEQFVRR